MTQPRSTTTASSAATPALDGFVPFPSVRADEYRRAGYWTGNTVESLLRVSAARRPCHPAVIDEHRALSYRELDEAADNAAHAFLRLGIAPGDRVLLQLPNRASFAVALFGLMRAGAIPVMCLPGHRSPNCPTSSRWPTLSDWLSPIRPVDSITARWRSRCPSGIRACARWSWRVMRAPSHPGRRC